jgi:hypothetical protein
MAGISLENSIAGQVPLAYRSVPRTFAPGRICKVDDCNTVLSVYNANQFCVVHDFDTRLSAVDANRA